MTAKDDGLFARWSRRKQAVRRVEVQISDKAAQAADARAVEKDVDPQISVNVSANTEAASANTEVSVSMPSLKDLTAAGDLSAFLRDGVPTALKNAAMRKMWSLDPAIRDHIGLSEYAWDFNQPGSMGGFGPLEAGKVVSDFLSTMSAALPGDSEGAITTTRVSPPQAIAATPGPAADLSPVALEPPSEIPTISQTSTTEVVDTTESTDALEFSPTSLLPRHGGALPS